MTNDTVEVDKKFLEAMVNKLEKAYEAEGQFKNTKISEVLVHLKMEATGKKYSTLLKEKIEEVEAEQ